MRRSGSGLVVLLAARGLGRGELRLGRSAVRITALARIPMGGYFALRLPTGTHDDLYARTLVLETAGVKAALVAGDLESIPRQPMLK